MSAGTVVRPCIKCGRSTEFAPAQVKKKTWWCRRCGAAHEREWRKTNPTIRARERARWHARKGNPDEQLKLRARRITRAAIARGEVARSPCEVCGRTIAEAHHDDYAKPLEIRWLCPHHHRQHHLAMNATAEARPVSPRRPEGP